MKEVLDDYEVCGTCGYDHAYDFPYLSDEQLVEVVHVHFDDFKNEEQR